MDLTVIQQPNIKTAVDDTLLVSGSLYDHFSPDQHPALPTSLLPPHVCHHHLPPYPTRYLPTTPTCPASPFLTLAAHRRVDATAWFYFAIALNHFAVTAPLHPRLCLPRALHILPDGVSRFMTRLRRLVVFSLIRHWFADEHAARCRWVLGCGGCSGRLWMRAF